MKSRTFLSVLGVLLVSVFTAFAQTIIPGGNVSGTWSAAGSPYLIEGEITIPSSDTLIIGPGVDVNFQGHYKFIVNGWLLAEGTENDSIIFTAADTSEGWHGIRFIDAPDSSHLYYCILQYGRATGPSHDNDGGAIYCESSNPSISNCTISGNSAVVWGGGIYCLDSSPSISNCAISGNSADSGGGIYCEFSNPSISNCAISGNTTDGSSGGICCYFSSPSISICVISGNTTDGSGGGIGCYSSPSSPSISNCAIRGNSAEYGGGIWCNSSSPSISNCTISGNSANIAGGIYCFYNSNASISSCTISGNTANIVGGIHCSNSSPSISSCTISGNTGGSSGGGICCFANSNASISNCTISGNTADYGGGIKFQASNPSISNCTISENTAAIWGGGIYCQTSSPSISSCTISGNTAQNSGGGIYCYYSNPSISDCAISENLADYGGGIYCFSNPSLSISNCTISGNTAQTSGGGISCIYSNPSISNCTIIGNSSLYNGSGIYCYYSNPSISDCAISENLADYGGGIYCFSNPSLSISNCTISGNTAQTSGGGIYYYSSSPDIVNTIVAGNFGNYGVTLFNSPDASITFSDFYNNQNGNFHDPPQGVGQIITTNANGDSCDTYMNIFLDPLFQSTTGDSAFRLTADSPCIDAGDPNSTFDPDNTIADMGAFYFDQNVSPIQVTLTPLNPPILIPANGGTFEFNIGVGNTGTSQVLVDIWTMVTLPNGSEYGPIINFPDFNLQPGTNPNRDRDQNVPVNAPAGGYTYNAYIGEYPDSVFAEDHFNFEKLAISDGGISILGWDNWGEEFGDILANSSTLLSELKLHPAHPNPFNPVTTISFDLPEACDISLVVYDVSGREVARLVDEFKSAGAHEVIFDGSNLSSGIYFARLQMDRVSLTKKMLLVK